jgi:hypothetical protein
LGTPPSITVQAGSGRDNSSTFTPELTPGTGYAYFSCGTDAPNASCAIATTDPLNNYVVNSSVAENVTVTVTTTPNSASLPAVFRQTTRKWLPNAIAELLLLALIALALRIRRREWRLGFMLAAGLILLGTLVASCGAGTATSPPGNTGTPPGTYTVTVYAFTESNTSNGLNADADASVSIPLTVN